MPQIYVKRELYDFATKAGEDPGELVDRLLRDWKRKNEKSGRKGGDS